MNKEKRFAEYGSDKKSELDIRSVLIVFGAVLLLAWTINIHIDNHIGFPVGAVLSFLLFCYAICLVNYTYSSICIAPDGIHYRNMFFARRVLKWNDIGKVYKTKAFIGTSEAIDVICCTVGSKKQKTDFSFDLAVLREKSYFMMGYSETRMKEISTNLLNRNSI